MNLKKLAAFGGVILGLGLVGKGYAAELVCVNNQVVLEKSTYAQTIKQKLEQKKNELMKKYSEKAKTLQQQLQAIQQQINSGLLSEDAKKEKEKELSRIAQQLQMLQFQMQQEYNQYMEQQLQKLSEVEQAALKALAKTLGFKAAVDCRALLYYSPQIDITDQTIKVMDQMAKQSK